MNITWRQGAEASTDSSTRLYAIGKFKTGLLDGNLSGISFLLQQVRPLVEAMQSNDRISIARLLKAYSPILSADKPDRSPISLQDMQKADQSAQSIFALWKTGGDPILLDVVSAIREEGLFQIPEIFGPIFDNPAGLCETAAPEDDKNPAIDAWRDALSVHYSQFAAYADYISDKSPFGTHQGIKGLQFPRVMVIMDDREARGFMFSYEKLLGAKAHSRTDMQNAASGKETAIDRTRRLFYVTCSRAQQSLALVVYTDEANKVEQHICDAGWFHREEIIRLPDKNPFDQRRTAKTCRDLRLARSSEKQAPQVQENSGIA